MPKLLNTRHSPKSLDRVNAEMKSVQQRLDALIASMKELGCEELVVNYQDAVERGLVACRNFVNDAETKYLAWRAAQGRLHAGGDAPTKKSGK